MIDLQSIFSDPAPDAPSPLDLPDAPAVWAAALDRLAGELPADILAACRAADVQWEPDPAPSTGAPNMDDRTPCPPVDGRPDGAPDLDGVDLDADPEPAAPTVSPGQPQGNGVDLDGPGFDLDADGWPVGSIEPQDCPTCPGLLTWQDARGRWRCETCDADATTRAQRLADGAAGSRERWPAIGRWGRGSKSSGGLR